MIHTDHRALTTEEYWHSQWSALQLPYRVDTRGYRARCYIRLLRQALQSGASSLLEIGCGAAQWLEYIHREFGLHVWGLDYSLGTCQVARKNLALGHVSPRIVCSDLFAAPFQPGQFDIVMSAGVVEHFDDFTPALAAARALVAPGGTLLTTVPNFGGWSARIRAWTDSEVFHMHRAITASELHSAYAALGLEEIQTGYFASFRIPYGPLARGVGVKRVLSLPVFVGARVLDRLLRSTYGLVGRGLESPKLSAEIFALGRVPLLPND